MISVTYNNKTIDQLKHLLSVTTVRIEAYRQFRKNSDRPEFKSLFNDYLIQRRTYAEELREAIRDLGGKVKGDPPGAFSALKRLWTDIKTTISNDAELTILEACCDTEKVTLEEYEIVLDDPELNIEIRELLTDQKAGIERALGRARQMGRIYD